MKKLRIRASNSIKKDFREFVEELGFENKVSEVVTLLIFLQSREDNEVFYIETYKGESGNFLDLKVPDKYYDLFIEQARTSGLSNTQYFFNLFYNYKMKYVKYSEI